MCLAAAVLGAAAGNAHGGSPTCAAPFPPSRCFAAESPRSLPGRPASAGPQQPIASSRPAKAPDQPAARFTAIQTRRAKEVPAETVTQPAAPGAKPAAAEAELPLSRDELFGVPGDNDAGSEKASPAQLRTGPPAEGPEGLPSQALQGGGLGLHGFLQFEPAYTYGSPGHWSRGVVRAQVEKQARLGERVKAKAALRLDVDPVYWLSDFYPAPVKEDQRLELLLRDAYIDFPVGERLELRLGLQQIVWGEVVGLFFADVVSARDLRDFILPSFEIVRIPQWAARAEYFWRDTHLEAVWIPVAGYDNIGKPGAEFYPFQPPPTPGFNQVLLDDKRPGASLANSNLGLRASGLLNGWDLSTFYYRSTSAAPTLYRQAETGASPPVVTFEPRHDRIWQVGGTLGKDLGRFVLQSEAVYTAGRQFEVARLSAADGVVPQDTLDYIFSLTFTLPKDGRLNLQAFQRIFFQHDPDILYDSVESGVSLLLSARLLPKVEPQIFVVQSLNSNDRMIRLRTTWYAEQNLSVAFGVDTFAGPPLGYFGRFANRDRLYGEVRYSF
jgi:hypothetical protein